MITLVIGLFIGAFFGFIFAAIILSGKNSDESSYHPDLTDSTKKQSFLSKQTESSESVLDPTWNILERGQKRDIWN